jgi:hypothetical protein
VFALNADEVPGPRSSDVIVHTLLETPAVPVAVPKSIFARSLTLTWKARNYMNSTRSASFVTKMIGGWSHSNNDKEQGVSIETVFAKYDRNHSGKFIRS